MESATLKIKTPKILAPQATPWTVRGLPPLFFSEHSRRKDNNTRKRNKGRRPTLLSNNCFNFSNNSDNTLKAMPDKDPYVALGLQRGASAKDIKKACKWWDVLDRCVLSVLVGACRCLLVVLACDACL